MKKIILFTLLVVFGTVGIVQADDYFLDALNIKDITSKTDLFTERMGSNIEENTVETTAIGSIVNQTSTRSSLDHQEGKKGGDFHANAKNTAAIASQTNVYTKHEQSSILGNKLTTTALGAVVNGTYNPQNH